jgi:uncharacterized protein YecT (DUF1311 family)
MRITIKVLLMAAMSTLASSALATEPEELSCGSKFDTAEAVNQCLAEAVILVERDLETMRQALLKALEVAQLKLQTVAGASTRPADDVLEKTQKAWRDYRDSNCNYYDHAYAGVSSPGTERVACQLRMTRQRMLELNSERQFWVYKFRESDMQVPAAP